jgi:hypothetical protein
MICTDPPWQQLAAYRWLAGFARDKVAPGGMLLTQVGKKYLPEQLAYFLAPSTQLYYVSTLAIVYGVRTAFPDVSLLLLFSKDSGDGDVKYNWPYRRIADTVNVPPCPKINHPWEQPVAPFKYWLARLAKPGWKIADPFAGSGTIAIAAKEIGDLAYIGTERERDVCRLAQDRLATIAGE